MKTTPKEYRDFTDPYPARAARAIERKAQVPAIRLQYAITALSDKLDEIKDYSKAGSLGNAAVSYDAIENLAWEAIKMLADIRGYMD